MKLLKHLTSSMALLLALSMPLMAVQAQEQTSETATLPASYEEVAEEYNALEEEALTQGTAAIDLFLAQQFEALYEQFNDGMAEAVPLEVLEQAYTQFTDIAPIGEPINTRAMALGGSATYMANYAWGETTLTASVAFDNNDQISGLNFQANSALPEDPALDYESETTFQLPFDGLWYTGWGGADRLHNYHVDAPPQRHAYDFIVWQDGSTFSGDGTTNEDYYAYGQPVLAPASGTVVAVVNDLPENQPQVETDEANPAGNHLVIQTSEAEFVYLAHLQTGSISVAVGDNVEVGQQVGLVGNSGNTSEPHLHIHLQDQQEMFVTDENGQITGFTDATGLPLVYSNYLENGELMETGAPIGGTFVQNAE